MLHEYAQTKCIGAILTPWAMTTALCLVIITPQPELYHAYGRVFCVTFIYVVILMIDAMIVNNNMILDQ